MSRRLVGLLAAIALVGSGAAALAGPTVVRQPAPVERTLLGSGTFHAFVQYDRPVRESDVEALQALGITRLRPFKHVDAVAVVAPTGPLQAAAALTGVTRVQRDNGIRLTLDKSKKALKVDQVRAAQPKGQGLTGKGVTVAVIDSGLDSRHPDFADRVKASYQFEGAWLYDQYNDGAISDFVAETTAPYSSVDEIGHGTHVASTVGGDGSGSLSGADYSGVAPGIDFVGFKIASAVQGVVYDFGWEANAMAAIEYLMEHPELGVDVVQNSWGIFEVTDPDSEPTIQMIRAAIQHAGLTFVFSAGNNGPDKDSVGWPGAMGNVITVGSTEKTAAEPGRYAMSDFSSRGPQVDVVAPGSLIVAARSTGAVIDLADPTTPAVDLPRYMAISGTSMSSPHVAGVVALMKEAHPRLTGEVAEEVLARTASDLGAKGKDHDYGWGFVDAVKATKVASCLRTATGKSRERCFTAVRALPAKAYRSDWRTKGDETPTSNGADVIPLVGDPLGIGPDGR